MTLDLTKIFSSWPFWTAVIVIAVVLIFRRQIVALIGRTHRLNLFGASVDAGDQTQQQQPGRTETSADTLLKKEAERATPSKDARSSADELLRHMSRTDYVAAKEKGIKEALESLGIADSPEQMSRVLLSISSVAVISVEFERIYGLIWGSQIKILQGLNAAGVVATEQLQPFYDEAAHTYPQAFNAYPFNNYLQFLVTHGLVEIAEGKVAITTRGRNFLIYLAHEGKALERSG